MERFPLCRAPLTVPALTCPPFARMAAPRHPARRACLLAIAAGAWLPVAQAMATLRIGVPNDVADDFVRFLHGRDIAALERFNGPYSRRDVMELAWLLREIKRQPQAPATQLVRIDSYERLLATLRDGDIDAIGTSAWRADLDTLGSGSVTPSPALIRQGEFVVGIYTSPRNEAALRVRQLAQLRTLRFVCNSAWSLDWATLRKLDIAPAFDVKTWGQMVALVDSGHADAVLAPFQPTANAMELYFEGKTLVPIDGLAVALVGTRHLASARTAQGQWVASRVFPTLAAQVKSGALHKAYEECGFHTPRIRAWTIL